MALRYKVSLRYEFVHNIEFLPHHELYQLGDIIDFDGSELGFTTVVGYGGDLIRLPRDQLVIPLEVTKWIPDAYDFYKNIISKYYTILVVDGRDLSIQRFLGGRVPREMVFVMDFSDDRFRPDYLTIVYSPGYEEFYDDPRRFPSAREVTRNYSQVQNMIEDKR